MQSRPPNSTAAGSSSCRSSERAPLDEIRIEQIGLQRAGELIELQAATFREAYADVHAREDIEAYIGANYTPAAARADLSADETVCCLGLVDSAPFGYYLVKHADCPIPLSSGSSELKQIYVLKSAYGRGLGRSLYAHAVAAIAAADRKWVWLCVSDINYRAQAFYRKLGFSKLGAGPVLEVGSDRLESSILACEVGELSKRSES